MGTVFLIGLGGFAGAAARYLVDTRVTAGVASALPWGTFLVNVSGSFLLGVTFALATERAVLPAELRLPLMVGFIGSYTTFGTPLLQSWLLFEEGAWLTASANLVGSILAGIIAVVAGLLIGRAP